ncbi:MAG: hypothetical protein WD066_17850 [Planctomycetaceae bacterium]
MTAAWMLTIALCAPPAETAAASESVSVGRVADPSENAADETTTAADLKAEHLSLMRRTARSQKPDPHECVTPLVGFRARLAADATLPLLQRRRLTRALDGRLVEMHTRLRHEIIRAERDAKRAPGTRMTAGGAAVPPAASELIDLIETTVAPDTWAVNGGQGTISYWRPGMALVIRQTGEVHHQIGGTLGQLRRARQ